MNDDVTREIRNAFKIQPGSVESIPKPIPVIEVGTKIVKDGLSVHGVATNATSQTLITTPTNQDFYICSAMLSVIKDVTSTSVSSRIQYIKNGATMYLLYIPGITLTAQTEAISQTFPHAIKVDRGTAITVACTSNVANIITSAVINYFLDEVNG